MKIKRCEYCSSIWVCWNWCNAWGGDLDKYCEMNPHISREKLKESMWGHECWDCEGVQDTAEKVIDGIPYNTLRKYYYYFHPYKYFKDILLASIKEYFKVHRGKNERN